MDNERIKGAAQKIRGSVEEAVGNVTGDVELQAEGKADTATGTVRNVIGSATDAIRDSDK